MSEHHTLTADLELAFELGELACAIALPLFQRGVTTQTKADGSPVTEADLEVERCLLEVISERRPADAVLSEESGARGSASRRWIFDPIDGTAHFAARRDIWGTHVALEQEGEVVLGLITRPVAGEWWWAARGHGAYRSQLGLRSPQQALRVSETQDPGLARVMLWTRTETALGPKLRELGQWVARDLNGVLQVASGRVDALIDDQGQTWDIAPAVVIVEEAGGRFTDRDGGRRLDRLGGWFTNGRLDGALRAQLSG